MDFKNMDKGQIIKYIAIAIGVYFVYKYVVSGSLFGDDAATALPGGAPAPQPSITTPPQQLVIRPPANLPPPPVVATVVPTDDQLMAAAFEASQAGQAGSYKLNGWQWNFYRGAEANRRGVYDALRHEPVLDSFMDPSQPITAAEYHSHLASGGISGLRGMGWSNNPTAGYSRWRN